MKTNQLTIIILTNQHDHRLKEAINSARFASQIIIINNSIQSFPKSLKLKNLTNYDWPNPISSFSKIRNQALELVDTEWTLFLDSDEVIPLDLQAEILNFTNQDKYNGLKLKRYDVFHDQVLKHGELAQQNLLRLARTKHFKFAGKVHEIGLVDGQVSTSTHYLLHFAHPTIDQFLKKIAKYSELVATGRKDVPINLNTLQLIIYPIVKFLYNYIIRLGILDGWAGFTYSVIMSVHSANVRVFTHENKL